MPDWSSIPKEKVPAKTAGAKIECMFEGEESMALTAIHVLIIYELLIHVNNYFPKVIIVAPINLGIGNSLLY